MIQFLLIALPAAALAAAGAVLAAVLQGKRAEKAEKEAESLHEAFRAAAEKAKRLQKALDDNEKIEGEADAARAALDHTPDGNLADRANALFLPERGESKSRSGGAGNPVASGA
jgi:hypothetical protein